MKKLFAIVFLLPLAFCKISAQSDTLHIYYNGLGTKILDSNETKIGKWAKSLNGKKMDLQVLCYYSDKEFKKYSQERADELFLMINRKARDLVNITTIGPVKGSKSQRSKADIVFIPQGQTPTPVVKATVTEKPVAEKTTKTEVAKITQAKEEKIKEEKPKKEDKKVETKTTSKKDKKQNDSKIEAPEAVTTTEPTTTPSSNSNGLDAVNSAPTTTVNENEPLKVMVNGEWVEYQNGKKVKKKKN